MPKELLAQITSVPELDSTSESEQMYLITVARVAETGTEGPVPVSQIAGDLKVSVPSANEMIRKLEGRGLLSYVPYRGVHLTDSGHRIADQVLRTRRLWATFLVDHLGFSPAAADDQACHLEHATSPEAANRLATFLGNPAAGPLGRPIPAATSAEERQPATRLAKLSAGASAEVVAVTATGRTLDFLTAEGIAVGSHMTVVASGESGLLVEVGAGTAHLQQELAASISVKLVPRKGET
jgi:DtxR family Mn-dependent transcriptional regulator